MDFATVPFPGALFALLLARHSRRALNRRRKPAQPESSSAKLRRLRRHTPKVGQILDRYEKAIGGREAWEKFTSQVMMGTIEVPSMNLSGTVMVHEKAPNKLLAAVIINGAAFQQGYDGIQGWTDDPKNGLRDQTGPELAESKRGGGFSARFPPAPRLHKHGCHRRRKRWRPRYLGDRSEVPEGGDPTKILFRQEDWISVAGHQPNHDADGVSESARRIGRLSRVDGVKVPFVWQQTNGDTTYTMTFSEVHHDVELE